MSLYSNAIITRPYTAANYDFCPDDASVSYAADQWLAEKAVSVKPSSLARYRSILRVHILPHFGHLKIRDVSAANIRAFSSEMSYRLKPKTVRDILTVLEQVLSYASEHMPTDYRVPLIVRPKEAHRPVRVLSISEQNTLVSFLLREKDIQKLGVLLCLYTGMRLGELCGLRWEDIDFPQRSLKIRRTIQRIHDEVQGTRFLIDTPKTLHSEREIPIPHFMIPLLQAHYRNTSAYVLTGNDTFVQPRTLQNRFKSYLRQCRLPESYHFHTLRHTFASRAIEVGFDPKTLSEILGHASVNMTLNRYVHSSLELKRRNMALLSDTVTQS